MKTPESARLSGKWLFNFTKVFLNDLYVIVTFIGDTLNLSLFMPKRLTIINNEWLKGRRVKLSNPYCQFVRCICRYALLIAFFLVRKASGCGITSSLLIGQNVFKQDAELELDVEAYKNPVVEEQRIYDALRVMPEERFEDAAKTVDPGIVDIVVPNLLGYMRCLRLPIYEGALESALHDVCNADDSREMLCRYRELVANIGRDSPNEAIKDYPVSIEEAFETVKNCEALKDRFARGATAKVIWDRLIEDCKNAKESEDG